MRRAATLVPVALLAAVPCSSQDPGPVFPSGTQVVVLDVIANDRKGVPVPDLRMADVRVTEDGRPCEVLSLRLVRASAAPHAKTPMATNAPPSASPASVRPSLVVLLFDRLTTKTAPLARQGALDLLQRPFPPDTWFGVFKIGYHLQLLAPFTTDTAALRAAVEQATLGDVEKLGGKLSPALPPVRPPDAETATERFDLNSGPNIPSLREVAKDISLIEQQEARRGEQLDSLYAVQAIARALEGVQGRKSLLYFAESVHLPPGTQGVYDSAISAANRANVAIDTVDARGLTSHRPEGLTLTDSVLDQFTVDNRGGAGEGAETPKMKAGGSGGPGMKLRDVVEREEEALAGPVLQRLAFDTGGVAIENTNDLGDGLSAVARELGQYYELVYAPANPTQDGRFRRIAVKSQRPDVRLRTRAGYFATPRQTALLPAYELPLMAALSETVPASHFHLRTGLLHFAPKGHERECLLLAEVPLSEVQLKSDEQQGVFRGHLSLLVYLKDEGGRTVSRLSHDWPLSGTLRDLPSARRQGAVFRHALSLAPGRYRLEAAVQDRASGAVSVVRSALEVPAPGKALSLGSVAAIREVSAAKVEDKDPLRTGNVSLLPDLGGPLEARAGGELPVFVPIYPARPLEPVSLELEFRRAGQVVARAQPSLPAADADGRIAWVGSVPWSQLKPGAYELAATVRQGEEVQAGSTRFEVAAASRDSAGPAKPRPPVDPALAAVLERAARYVVEYADTFGNLVAEESYTQRSWGTDEGLRPTETAPLRMGDHQLQRTRADLVFVRLAGDVPWGLFRDVFEANGVKVHDRDARLEQLFRAQSPSAVEQASRVLAESARYNIGPRRTVNLPTMALMFLHPRNQSRFAWKGGGRRRIASVDGLELEFEEIDRPAITSDLAGGSVPASGRFFVDPQRGTVLRSEVHYHFEPNRAVGTINTEYRPEPRLALWVPAEMYEQYEDRAGTRDPVFYAPAEAVARYSNFRRFEVTTQDQKATLPPP